jgi:hypothetical protein
MCKRLKFCYSGPKAPSARRDLSLPYYWVANHDILLLQLTALDSLPARKRRLFASELGAESEVIAVDETDVDPADKDKDDVTSTNWSAIVLNASLKSQWPSVPVSNPGTGTSQTQIRRMSLNHL